MPQITAVMITAGKSSSPLIEYLIRKTAPTGTNQGQGRLLVCDLRARSLPTFHPTELWLANCETRLRCRTPFDSTTRWEVAGGGHGATIDCHATERRGGRQITSVTPSVKKPRHVSAEANPRKRVRQKQFTRSARILHRAGVGVE